MVLKTDYKDDILNTNQNTARKYKMTTDSNGYVSFEDVSSYSQTGDLFGAKQLNETNAELNKFYQEKVSYLAGKNFDTVDEMLEYITSLLEKYAVACLPISISDANNILAPYSSGFATIKWDTCTVIIFRYLTGKMYVNGRSKNVEWIGWKEALTTYDLEKFLPLSGGKISGNLEITGSVSVKTTTENTRQVGVENSLHNGAMLVSDNGNFGLYDTSFKKWIAKSDATGEVNYAKGTMNGLKLLQPSDFVITGSTEDATLTINLD